MYLDLIKGALSMISKFFRSVLVAVAFLFLLVPAKTTTQGLLPSTPPKLGQIVLWQPGAGLERVAIVNQVVDATKGIVRLTCISQFDDHKWGYVDPPTMINGQTFILWGSIPVGAWIKAPVGTSADPRPTWNKSGDQGFREIYLPDKTGAISSVPSVVSVNIPYIGGPTGKGPGWYEQR